MKPKPNPFPKIIAHCCRHLDHEPNELDKLMGWPSFRSTFILEGLPMTKQELLDLGLVVGRSGRELLLCNLDEIMPRRSLADGGMPSA